LDEKKKFRILDTIWKKNGPKMSNSFTFVGITIMLLQLVELLMVAQYKITAGIKSTVTFQ